MHSHFKVTTDKEVLTSAIFLFVFSKPYNFLFLSFHYCNFCFIEFFCILLFDFLISFSV